MVIFEKIKYKNFLASGNHFIEVPLNKFGISVITGTNGAGKSTISDAICFCLFNKGFRDIPKGNFVNSVNGRETVVETVFNVNSKKYLVRRGIKPSIFEIEVDGEMLDQVSNVKDQQKYLETHILGMNWKSFTQIVILGSASHVPFMQLKTPERRLIIEDLLDLQVFSKMKKALKDRTDTLKSDLNDVEGSISLLESKIDLQRKYLEKSNTENKEKIEKNQSIIDETKGLISAEVEKLKEQQTLLDSTANDDLSDTIESERNRQQKYQNIKSRLESRISQLKSEIEFFETTQNCPTCKSVITEEQKQAAISSNNSIIDECYTAIEKADETINECKEHISELAKKSNDIRDIKEKITIIKNTIISHEKFIKKIQSDIDEYLKEDTNTEVSKELEKSRGELEVKKEEKVRLEEEREIQNLATVLLKDTGIKTNIIKKFVPVINQVVNKYLGYMDFFIKFKLDENFNESIKSRHIDDYRYGNFSEGERRRIDLAILMSWIEVAARKNSLNCNLLILDELFDGALDSDGIDAFSKILKNHRNKNIFVITHKMELIDKLESEKNSHIHFEKYKGFSRIAK